MTDVLALVERFRAVRVLVVGDALLDDYLVGHGVRICREAPVPAVTVDERRPVPGGAGNLAANLAALGAQVAFVGVVGADADGVALQRALRERGVAPDRLVVAGDRRTVAKRRVVAGEQILVRFDEGGAEPLDPASERAVVAATRELLPTVDLVVVSDYGYGVLADAVVRCLADRGDVRLVVDAHDPARYAWLRPEAVKPNADEVGRIAPGVRQARNRAEAVRGHGEEVLDAFGAQVAAVTLDRDGAVVLRRGAPAYRTYSRPRPDSHACGAGDSYTAALALGLAAGADLPEVAELAAAAADVVLDRTGTTVCTAAELCERLLSPSARLEDPARLQRLLDQHRRHGRRIVFTNGCFDVLHRGHIDFLNRAKALGDVLVVGLNSDAGIRELKGPGHPTHRLEDRAEVLAALSCVDHLVAFDAATADELVALLRPDVYAKGGDYTREMLPEAGAVEAAGGRLELLPYVSHDDARVQTGRHGVGEVAEPR